MSQLIVGKGTRSKGGERGGIKRKKDSKSKSLRES